MITDNNQVENLEVLSFCVLKTMKLAVLNKDNSRYAITEYQRILNKFSMDLLRVGSLIDDELDKTKIL